MGLGQTYEIDGGTRRLEKSHILSYGESFQSILEKIIVVFVIVLKPIPCPSIILPASIWKVKNSVRELAICNREMMAEQRAALHQSGAVAVKKNLMSVLLKSIRNDGR